MATDGASTTAAPRRRGRKPRAAAVETAIADDQYDAMFGSAKSKVTGYSERLTLWEKLTNTVELKLLMHQSQVGAQQDFIQKELNALTKRKRKDPGKARADRWPEERAQD